MGVNVGNITKLDQAYSERNYLAIALAQQTLRCGGSAGWKWEPIEDWDEGWGYVVYIEISDKQISYHLTPEQGKLAAQVLPEYTGEWDREFTGRSDQFIDREFLAKFYSKEVGQGI
jgi:hypothetical protein